MRELSILIVMLAVLTTAVVRTGTSTTAGAGFIGVLVTWCLTAVLIIMRLLAIP